VRLSKLKAMGKLFNPVDLASIGDFSNCPV